MGYCNMGYYYKKTLEPTGRDGSPVPSPLSPLSRRGASPDGDRDIAARTPCRSRDPVSTTAQNRAQISHRVTLKGKAWSEMR